MIDCYFWSIDCYYCNLQRLDWPLILGRADDFFTLTWPPMSTGTRKTRWFCASFLMEFLWPLKAPCWIAFFLRLGGEVWMALFVCFLSYKRRVFWGSLVEIEVTWDHLVLLVPCLEMMYAQFSILFVTVVVVWRGPGFNYLWYVCIVGVSYTSIHHKLYYMCIHVQYTMCLRQRSSIQYLQTGHQNRTCGFRRLWNTLRVRATYSVWYQTALVIGLIPFLALHNPRFLLDKHRWIQIQTSSQGEWSRSWWSSPLPWISVLRSQRVTTLAERHMGWYCMGISWLKHGCVCMSSHCLKSGSSRSTSGITYAWLTL